MDCKVYNYYFNTCCISSFRILAITNPVVLVGAPKASKCFGEDQATMVLMDTPGDVHTRSCSTANNTRN